MSIKRWSVSVVRISWLLLVVGLALAPWQVKLRLGLSARHHDAWHLVGFFLTAIVFSDLVQGQQAGYTPSRVVRRRIVQSLAAVVIAISSEILEVLWFRSPFEWRDVIVDCAGVVLGCAVAWHLTDLLYTPRVHKL